MTVGVERSRRRHRYLNQQIQANASFQSSRIKLTCACCFIVNPPDLTRPQLTASHTHTTNRPQTNALSVLRYGKMLVIPLWKH
jgi:hypothetical protein